MWLLHQRAWSSFLAHKCPRCKSGSIRSCLKWFTGSLWDRSARLRIRSCKRRTRHWKQFSTAAMKNMISETMASLLFLTQRSFCRGSMRLNSFCQSAFLDSVTESERALMIFATQLGDSIQIQERKNVLSDSNTFQFDSSCVIYERGITYVIYILLCILCHDMSWLICHVYIYVYHVCHSVWLPRI